MGFRDDGLANQERTEALEREVARLQAENAALRERGEASPRPERSALARAAAPLGLTALALVVGAALVPLPPVGRVAFVLLATLALVAAAMAKVLGDLVHIVQPGEMVVFSGRRYRTADGRELGYRIAKGGRMLRMPLVEAATRMELGPFPITLEVRGTYAQRSAVDLLASATVAVRTDEPFVHNAVERFLGRPTAEIIEVARQTIEGAVREVAAELTIDELRGDSTKVAARLSHELERDLERLGLRLDTLVIERVTATEAR